MSTTNLTGELVLRAAFDEATESIKTLTTIDSISTEIELSAADGDSVQNLPAILGPVSVLTGPAETTVTSSSLDVSDYRSGVAVVRWENLTGTLDGSLKVQGSIDSTYWFDIQTVTLNSANGQTAVTIASNVWAALRVDYTANGVTGGDFFVDGLFKS